MIKPLEIEENILNLIKGIYKKPIANLILNYERPVAFPLRSRITSHHFYSML